MLLRTEAQSCTHKCIDTHLVFILNRAPLLPNSFSVSVQLCTIGPEAAVSQPPKSTNFNTLQHVCVCLILIPPSTHSFTQFRHRQNLKTSNPAWGGFFILLSIKHTFVCLSDWQMNEGEKTSLQFRSMVVVIKACLFGGMCTPCGFGLNSFRCYYAVSDPFCHLLSPVSVTVIRPY